jgi:hypothetical protein
MPGVPALSAATQPEPAALASGGAATRAVATVPPAVVLRRVSPRGVAAAAVALALVALAAATAVALAVAPAAASQVQDKAALTASTASKEL